MTTDPQQATVRDDGVELTAGPGCAPTETAAIGCVSPVGSSNEYRGYELVVHAGADDDDIDMRGHALLVAIRGGSSGI